MIVALTLPSLPPSAREIRDPAGRLTMDVPGFGRLVQVTGDLEQTVRTKLTAAPFPVALDLSFPGEDTHAGLWMRETDLEGILAEKGVAA